jgi:hypothetical protein
VKPRPAGPCTCRDQRQHGRHPPRAFARTTSGPAQATRRAAPPSLGDVRGDRDADQKNRQADDDRENGHRQARPARAPVTARSGSRWVRGWFRRRTRHGARRRDHRRRVEREALYQLVRHLFMRGCRNGRRRRGAQRRNDRAQCRVHGPRCREARSSARRRVHLTVTGVPTGISFASLKISALRMRMQPCEIAPGISRG